MLSKRSSSETGAPFSQGSTLAILKLGDSAKLRRTHKLSNIAKLVPSHRFVVQWLLSYNFTIRAAPEESIETFGVTIKVLYLFVLLVDHRLQFVFVIFDEDGFFLLESLVLLFLAELVLESLE